MKVGDRVVRRVPVTSYRHKKLKVGKAYTIRDFRTVSGGLYLKGIYNRNDEHSNEEIAYSPVQFTPEGEYLNNELTKKYRQTQPF